MKWFHVLLGVLAVILPACSDRSASAPKGGSGDARRVKVAFVSNNTEEFWTIAEAGTRKAAEEEKVEVIFRRPKSPTAAAQQEIIEDLLTQGVQSIAISVIDPKNQHDFLNDVAGRVPLITQDNDAPATKRKCYIGTDNYTAGRAVGKLIKETMKSGTVAIFVGQPDPLNAQERRHGVLDELAGVPEAEGMKGKHAPPGKQYGAYTLFGTKYDDANRGKAKDNAADVLTQLRDQGDVCLIGLWAYNPPAILEAVQEAGRAGKVRIVGFDEDEKTLQGIKDGHIYATVVQQPFEFGYQSVKLMTNLVRAPKETALPADGIKHVEHLVIKKEPRSGTNEREVEAFHQNLRRLLAKS